jgi:hypothetical protein
LGLVDIEPLDCRQSLREKMAKPAIQQHLAAICMLLDRLIALNIRPWCKRYYSSPVVWARGEAFMHASQSPDYVTLIEERMNRSRRAGLQTI